MIRGPLPADRGLVNSLYSPLREVSGVDFGISPILYIGGASSDRGVVRPLHQVSYLVALKHTFGEPVLQSMALLKSRALSREPNYPAPERLLLKVDAIHM